MSLTDGRGSAPSPFGIAVMLILGGIIWVVQQVWELMKMGFDALVSFALGIEDLLKGIVEFLL
jgi:hypothetical protein